jgi:hypothetical protein
MGMSLVVALDPQISQRNAEIGLPVRVQTLVVMRRHAAGSESSDFSSVSVAIEEMKPQDWAEKVYTPEILNSPEKLYKKPGYTM